MKIKQLPTEVARVLAEHHTLTLATSLSNEPWASQVFFAEEIDESGRIRLYFASLKPSRKWRHLTKNPLVSFAVGTPMPSRWVQGAGIAELVTNSTEQERIVDLIKSKASGYEHFIRAVDADFFVINVDEVRVVDLTHGTPMTFWKRPRTARPGGLAGFLAATRAQVLPVILLPVTLGAAFFWWQGGAFSWIWYLVTLLGAGALHLFANVVNDVFDIRSGADRVADALDDSVRTGSPLATARLAVVLGIVGATCGAILAAARDPLVLAFGLVGATIALFYVAPPIAFGYRGRGLGEIGILVSFGLLPTVGSYYVQAIQVPREVWGLGLIPGLLTTLVLYHHHFLHFRADRVVGKMTPVAALGPKAALGLSRPVLVAAALLLVAMAVLALLPLMSLAALLPLVIAWRAIGITSRKHDLPAYRVLVQSTVATSALSTLIMIVSLVGDRVLMTG